MQINKNMSARSFKPHYVEFVYSLTCPIKNDVFYVGKTVNPNQRLLAHSSDCNTLDEEDTNEKRKRIKEIKVANLVPKMDIVTKTEVWTTIDKMAAHWIEVYWIQELAKQWPLTNIKDIKTKEEQLDYYLKYVYPKSQNQKIPIDYYFFDYRFGERIYDLHMLRADGGWIPYESSYKPLRFSPDSNNWPINGYNPWLEPKFLAMMGIKDDSFENITYDTKAYRDLDPKYYDNDY